MIRMRNLYLYLRMSIQNIRALMEYKNDFIVSTVAGAVWQAVGLVFLFALFNNIQAIAGWTLYEVALLYACVMFSEGTLTFLFQGTTGFTYYIRSGQFDRFIVRPVNILTQILGMQINFAGLCTMITAIGLMIVSLYKLQVSISFGDLLLLTGNLAMGVYIRINMNVSAAAFSFWTVSSAKFNTLFYNMQSFAKYPLTIFPKSIQILLVTVLPHAMISYVPVCLLLKKIPIWPYILAVPASVVFISCFRKILFAKAVRNYESAGN